MERYINGFYYAITRFNMTLYYMGHLRQTPKVRTLYSLSNSIHGPTTSQTFFCRDLLPPWNTKNDCI